MLPLECLPNRRTILKSGAALAAGLSTFSAAAIIGAATVAAPSAAAAVDDTWVVGPRPGFTPEVGTLTSMLAFTRDQVVHNVQGLSMADLDWLLDAKANTIGALLLHLAATETYYAATTFGGAKWDAMPADLKKKWDVPMNLDQPARDQIKGHPLDYYLDALHASREATLAQFRKVDDKWLTIVETDGKFSVNNYGKWFHVAEHESNHDGQIKFLKSRVPGAKPAKE
ncbi:MAG TPA: DinB family protein [Candidatus Acidoferrales bacterium]